MTIPPTDVAGRLDAIARHLLATDGPHADWFNEAIALARTGTSLDQALDWGGYPVVLKHEAREQTFKAVVAVLPGPVTAAAVHRQLTVWHPSGPAAAYIRAGGRTSLRSVHRRLAALRAANVTLVLAGDSAA
jgi:hypothetical protein